MSAEKKTSPRHEISQCHNELLGLMCHFVHSKRQTDCFADTRPFSPKVFHIESGVLPKCHTIENAGRVVHISKGRLWNEG